VAYNLVITPAASLDVLDACIYYERVETGLSERFMSEVLATYNKLAEHPQYYSYLSPKRKNELRDVKLKHFPYLVIFDIAEDTVTIYAVFNTHRKPKYK
jgi:mRNA-degrading endonuclease RelE of RelBE toxin-antitoxin system